MFGAFEGAVSACVEEEEGKSVEGSLSSSRDEMGKRKKERQTFHFNFCMLRQDIAVNGAHTINLAVIVLGVKTNVVGGLQTEKGYGFAA